MRRFFIIDTNVVVAGLITQRADVSVVRILDGMLRAEFGFVLSEELLAEYRSVLERSKLRKLHGLSTTEIEIVLTDIAQHAIVLTPCADAKAPVAPDAGDQFLWNLLASRSDLILVTGAKLPLQDVAMQGRVILPQTFAAQRWP
ncbi:MAG: putative toxin-antitoxin system toxin component, PIN family [Comamonadaceae bacterium CG_4_9_14_3_um_filter_60_33]|nr:MAG: putative toxin-antitoxin system toxin component, PIN family [Comamonadaceae bacterium CG2_30_59_20]PIY29359.1 MAG: putative toxin-antitoxin system toxin component, PIN family [Comamonadaceae bacterium CG_4_10_14_3_um_filter_60_42]PJB43198.1 MAG: putative toxin-antitoxin system toxin component, PIN family [Comamonadaceae bacterium CG_4_9_14_3_um_filter_60_33]